jgi:hypothetical protein
MKNSLASNYLDRIMQSGKRLFPSELKVVEICKQRTFENKDLTGSQGEALREIYKEIQERMV